MQIKNKYKQMHCIIAFCVIMVAACAVILSMHERREMQAAGANTIVMSSNPSSFLSTWNTTLTSIGSSGIDQVHLPLVSNGTYDFVVAWGDGSTDTITAWNQAQVTHTYASPGVYAINITGAIQGWEFDDGGDCLKLIGISQWGALGFGNTGYNFAGCANLVLTSTDAPGLAGTTTLNSAFYGCASLGSNGSMDKWDVSSVTNMGYMFQGATSFDQPIGKWDMLRVTNMSYMFQSATSFDQPICNWSVSSVTDMTEMFFDATSFDQPIGNWNVSRVTDMYGMFLGAGSFDQPIGNWDVSRVTDMTGMFLGAVSFDQPIGNWSVSSVTDMTQMFFDATSFDQPIGNWDVSRVTEMAGMFFDAKLSPANYDALLLGWAHLTLQYFVDFDAGNSKYSSGAAPARASIISNFMWTITDGGLAPNATIGAPRDLLVLPRAGKVELSWTMPAGGSGSPITNYSIYMGTSAGAETLFAIVGNVTSYTATSLENGREYYFMVAAMNAVGTGANSTEASATPATVPSAPLGLVMTPMNGSVVLKWTAPAYNGGSPVTNYTIYMGTAPGEEVYLKTVGNVTSCTAMGLTNGETYYFKVSALNGEGEGAPSTEVSATPASGVTPAYLGRLVLVVLVASCAGIMAVVTLIIVIRITRKDKSRYKEARSMGNIEVPLIKTPMVPSAPRYLRARVQPAQIELSWQPPEHTWGSRVIGYMVYRNNELIATLGDTREYADKDVKINQKYRYWVVAINDAGEGLESSELVVFKPPP